MSRTKTILTGLVVAAVAVASLIPLANAASAHEWQHNGGRHVYAADVNRWGEVRRSPDAYEYRHDAGDDGYRRHHRDNVGGAVAVGIFATVLGLALAAESNRVQHRYYDDSND